MNFFERLLNMCLNKMGPLEYIFSLRVVGTPTTAYFLASKKGCSFLI